MPIEPDTIHYSDAEADTTDLQVYLHRFTLHDGQLEVAIKPPQGEAIVIDCEGVAPEKVPGLIQKIRDLVAEVKKSS